MTVRAERVEEWRVYILKCRDNTLYTGICKNLTRRISQHRAGTASRYTRGRGPVTLVYSERAKDRSSALRRESEIKRMPRLAKTKLLSA